MWILVDYDNVRRVDTARGLDHVVFRILQAIGPENLKHTDHAAVRLYGGWYDADVLSRRAQDLSVDIASAFPAPRTVQVSGDSHTVRVTVQLARSLVADPKRDLLHTFRRRGFPGGLQCVAPPFPECGDPSSCPIEGIHVFLTDRACPEKSCDVHPKRVISRAEQKLVDTMMVADLVELTLRGDRVAIVSSDDDVWPGIRTCLDRTESLIHVHTRPSQATPPIYTEGLSKKYIERRMV